MYTLCPQCNTCFRVTAKHLEIAKGKVRCGSCNNVFDATHHLYSDPPADATPPATTPAANIEKNQEPSWSPDNLHEDEHEHIDLSASPKIEIPDRTSSDQTPYMESIIGTNSRYNNLDDMDNIELPGQLNINIDDIFETKDEQNNSSIPIGNADNTTSSEKVTSPYEDTDNVEQPTSTLDLDAINDIYLAADTDTDTDIQPNSINTDSNNSSEMFETSDGPVNLDQHIEELLAATPKFDFDDDFDSETDNKYNTTSEASETSETSDSNNISSTKSNFMTPDPEELSPQSKPDLFDQGSFSLEPLSPDKSDLNLISNKIDRKKTTEDQASVDIGFSSNIDNQDDIDNDLLDFIDEIEAKDINKDDNSSQDANDFDFALEQADDDMFSDNDEDIPVKQNTIETTDKQDDFASDFNSEFKDFDDDITDELNTDLANVDEAHDTEQNNDVEIANNNYQDDDVPLALRESLAAFEQLQRPRWQTVSMIIGVIILSFGISFQFLKYRNVEIANSLPSMQPLLNSFCNTFDCKYIGETNIRQIDIQSKYMYSHASIDNAIVIDTTIVNQATEPTPYPVIRITLKDISANTVAQRTLLPKQYLNKEFYHRFLLMDSGVPIHLAIEVKDPGEDAINFEIEFVE